MKKTTKQLPIDLFHLVRYKNILIFLLLQVLLWIRYYYHSEEILNYFLFNLVFAFFAAAGNLQNNILDFELDRHNKKPKLPDSKPKKYESVVYVLYGFGLILGYYLSFKMGINFREWLVIPVLLSLYNYFLKKLPLIGNIVVSFLIAYVIALPADFFIIHKYASHIETINFYAVMAFFLNLIREIVKDIEDVDGDKLFGYQTLPVLSTKHTHIALIIIILAYLSIFFYYTKDLIIIRIIYLVPTTVIPLAYVYHLINSNKTAKASKMIKYIMLLGIISILL